MTLRNLIIRTEIKLLLKHFPHQVKDILDEQGRHIKFKPGKAPKPTAATQTADLINHYSPVEPVVSNENM